jgi:DNA-binding IclR family transcriptional regulator
VIRSVIEHETLNVKRPDHPFLIFQKKAFPVSIAVVRKTLFTLEKLAESEEPLSLAVLSAQAKLPKPTAHRILQTLAALGYVAQDEENKYYLTTKLDALAQSGRSRDLKLRAVPAMTALHRQFNETVNLGVLEGTKVHYLHVIETSRSLRMMVQPNAADEYYFTAIGRAIAAHLPDSEIEAILKSTTLRPITPKTVSSRKKLEKILQETRRRGWAIDNEESVLGVVCLAVPMFRNERPVAAISVTMPKSRATKEACQSVVEALLSLKT